MDKNTKQTNKCKQGELNTIKIPKTAKIWTYIKRDQKLTKMKAD